MPETKEQSLTRVVTGVVRLSYEHVWEPKSVNDGAPKFSASLIIPKSDTKTVAAINAAIKAATEDGRTRHNLKGAIKSPLKDGDAERPDDEPYKDSYFLNALSVNPPVIVDLARKPITDKTAVYSGVYVRASLNFYGFNKGVNKGIACGLNGLQLIRDGEPLGGRADVSRDFDDGYGESLAGEDDFLS